MSNTPKTRVPAQPLDGTALAMRHLAEAFAVTLEIMRDKAAHPATRLRAAGVLIDRALGRVGKAVAKAVAAVHPGPFVNAPKFETHAEWQRFVDSMPGRSASGG